MIIQELVNIIGFKLNESELAAAERHIISAADGIEKIGQRLTLFITLPLAALAGSSVVATAKVEQFQTAFEVMLHDASKAKGLMKELFAFEAQTPFNLQQVMDLSQKLLIAKQPVETITKELMMLGNVAAGSADRMNSIVYVLGQVRALGYLQGQDIMQFTNALVPIRDAISKVTGVTGKALQDMIEKRQITAEITEKALEFVSKDRLGMMERQSKTLVGLWSSFVSAIFRFQVAIGSIIVKQFQLNKLVQNAINFFDRLEHTIDGMNPALQKILLWAGMFTAALGPLLVGLALFIKLWSKLSLLLIVPKTVMLANIMAFGKFLVIGAAIAAVIISIALSVEDFITYMQGGQSVVGKFLEPWATLGPKIKSYLEPLIDTFQTVFNTIVNIAQNVVGFILSLLSGDALSASLNLQKLIDNVLILIGGLMVAIAQMLYKFIPIIWQVLVFTVDKFCHLIYNIFYSIMDTIITFVWDKVKWLTNLVAPFAGKAWKGLSQGIASLPAPGAFNTLSPAFSVPSVNGVLGLGTKNQINVNSTIQMTIPEGTPQAQIKFVQSAAEKAVKEQLGKEMRNVLINFPETE